MTIRLRDCLLGLSVAILLASGGCTVLRPAPDVTKFYTLAPVRSASENPPDAMPGEVLGVGPVTLPAYLDRDQIVRRVDATRVELLEYDRWAEPLQKSTERVLVLNLSRALGTEHLLAYPWPLNRSVDHAVAVSIDHFEPVAAGGAQLVARWSIRAGGSDRTLLARDAVISVPAGRPTIGASVDAMSQALGTLADEIAAALRQVGAGANPKP